MFKYNLISNLRNLFRRKSNRNASKGSAYPVGFASRYARKRGLELPFQPIRPILTYQDTIELVEMAVYSYELRHGVSTIARDCFLDMSGSVTSWKVAETYKGQKINPDVVVIANDLANRTAGKELILGGDFFQRAARECLSYGDSFISLGFDKDGISNNYHISDTLYLPPLSVFVDLDEKFRIASYSQRESVMRQQSDIIIHPLKILHCSYEKNVLYGNPISFQSLDAWRELKETTKDLEQAARDTGNSLLAHIMPEGSSALDKQQYQSQHESILAGGIITNLYLLPGTEIKRIANDAKTLEPLLNLWLQKRYMCIPPGLPLYLYPGLGLDSRSSKELATQPALNYARFISGVRKMLSKQIKIAVNIELVLTKGYDFYEENKNFDIVWGDWLLNFWDNNQQSDTDR